MSGPAGVVLIVLGCLALAAAGALLLGPVRGRSPVAAVSPVRARLLERAARSLLNGPGSAPAAYVVSLGDHDVVVRSAAGTTLPPPWVAGDDGWWTVRSSDLDDGADAPGTSDEQPYVGLVRLARQAGRDVLVDLGRAPGLVALGGDPAASRAAALHGVRDLLARASPYRLEVTVLEDPQTALDALGIPRDPVGPSDDGVLVRRAAPTRGGPLRLLVLERPPSPTTARLLTACVESAAASLAVLVVGDLDQARWRLAVDRSGKLNLGVLGAVPEARPVAQGSA